MIGFLYPDEAQYISFDDWVLKFTKKPKNIFKKRAKSTSADWMFSPIQIYTNFREYIGEL